MAKVKVLSPNSGAVDDQAQLSVPNSPSYIGVRIIEVEDTPPATPSWADVLAIGAGNGGTVPVLDTKIETVSGLPFSVVSDQGFRAELANGTLLLALGTQAAQLSAPPGASLVRGTSNSARWYAQIILPLYFVRNFAMSAPAGTTQVMWINQAGSIGPFDSAGNMVSILVTASMANDVPMPAGMEVSVQIRKNGVAWYTVQCVGNGVRQSWMLSGSMAAVNQFLASDIITGQEVLVSLGGYGGTDRPFVSSVVTLRCGGN